MDETMEELFSSLKGRIDELDGELQATQRARDYYKVERDQWRDDYHSVFEQLRVAHEQLDGRTDTVVDLIERVAQALFKQRQEGFSALSPAHSAAANQGWDNIPSKFKEDWLGEAKRIVDYERRA